MEVEIQVQGVFRVDRTEPGFEMWPLSDKSIKLKQFVQGSAGGDSGSGPAGMTCKVGSKPPRDDD